jgi:Transglutaminase-like superfamily
MQICAPASQTSDAAIAAHPEPGAAPVCFFSAHAYVHEFDDGVIILDLRNDTYVGVDARHLSDLRTRIGNWPDSGRSSREAECHDISTSESLIAELLTRGILTTSRTPTPPTPATTPTTALTVASFGVARTRIPLGHAVQFAIAFVVVALRLRRNGLASLVDWLRRHQSSIQPGHSVTHDFIVARLGSFLWLRTWCYTAQRRCLLDSLVLSVYLTRGMVPCTFVIGVATKPFVAHAWVQIAGSVLNDTVEHVQEFGPILSVSGE